MKNNNFLDKDFLPNMEKPKLPLGTTLLSSNSSSSSSSSSSIRSGGPNPFKGEKPVPPSLLPPSLSNYNKTQPRSLVPGIKQKSPPNTPTIPSVIPSVTKTSSPTFFSSATVTTSTSAPSVIPNVTPPSPQNPLSNAPQKGEKADRIFYNTERISSNVEFAIYRINDLAEMIARLKIAEQNKEIDVLKKEMETLREESEEYKAEMEALKEESEKYKKEIDELKLKVDKSDGYEKEINELKLRMEEFVRSRQEIDNNKRCDANPDEEKKMEEENKVEEDKKKEKEEENVDDDADLE